VLLTSNAKIDCGSNPPSIPIFASNAVEMDITSATEDFSALRNFMDIPYAYWNLGEAQVTVTATLPPTTRPFYAPVIQPSLKAGTDAVALAVLVSLD
jgi:hypothetical protein